MSLGKLIRVERTINIYKKTRSKFQGIPVKEICIDMIALDTLTKILKVDINDPESYHFYELNEEQLNELNLYIDDKIIPDLKNFEYWIETYGIYEKSEK